MNEHRSQSCMSMKMPCIKLKSTKSTAIMDTSELDIRPKTSCCEKIQRAVRFEEYKENMKKKHPSIRPKLPHVPCSDTFRQVLLEFGIDAKSMGKDDE